jgi:hypothetical protein
MVVELLALRIRIDPNIKGIKIGSTEIKLVQMADDTTTFVNDINSLENIFKLLEIFERYAGLKLNKTKTEAMWLGKQRNNTITPLEIKWVREVHSLGIFFSYDNDSVVQKNFMDRAKEYKKILDIWSQRDLSLIGKITVLKSLAFSKIIYQCGVMNPPKEFEELITDISYKFIWKNKPEKIKRMTLISDYEHGGQKMIDIKSFLKAQKAMWMKRLVTKDNASWKAVPNLFLEQMLGTDTWKCDPSCVVKLKDFPDFYWQILKCWCEVKNLNNEIENPMDIRRQCLWYNNKIKVNKKEIWSERWHQKGINLIHDIVTKEGTFLTSEELTNKYQVKCNVLNYNAIKDALPLKWRTKLKTMNVPKNAISFQEQPFLKIGKIDKPIQIITNKEIYWSFVVKKQIKPIIIEKMQKELGIESTQWKEIFTLTKDINHTKMRAFQYRVLFNLIPCNWYLNKIKRSGTDKCPLCNLLDDITHYFYECNETRVFWNGFLNWWKQMTGDEIKLNKTVIIVGYLEKYVNSTLLNVCIVLAKWNIYRSKLDQSNPFFYKFLCDIKYNMKIEKIIALKNNKLMKYNKIWEILEEYIT